MPGEQNETWLLDTIALAMVLGAIAGKSIAPKMMGTVAYEYADGMLKERKRRLADKN